MVVPKVRLNEGGALFFGGEAEDVGPHTIRSVGEIVSKTHVESTSRPLVSTAVVGSAKSDEGAGFDVEKVVGGMKGKEKMGENGLGLIDLGSRGGYFDLCRMM